MNWLRTEMNKYIVISSVIPVIPQSFFEFVQIFKFVQDHPVQVFLLFLIVLICFVQILPGHPLLVALWPCSEHHGNWARRSFASEFSVKLRNVTSHYISWEKDAKKLNLVAQEIVSVFFFPFCSLSNFLEGLAVAGHWSSSGSQSQQPSGIDFHFQEMSWMSWMSWMWCSMKRNNESKYSNSTRGLAL